MITKMVNFLNKNPVYETLYGFDYHWPASLGIPFLQTKISYLEHFARDRDEKEFIPLSPRKIQWQILIEIKQ